MCHEASEVLTGYLPAPIKYRNHEIRDAYRRIEGAAAAGYSGYIDGTATAARFNELPGITADGTYV